MVETEGFQLGSLALCISSCLATKYGSGHHTSDIPISLLKSSLQIGFGGLIVYQVTLALTKISICFFYLRLFSDTIAKRLIYLTIAVILLYAIPTVLFSVFQCNPVRGYWIKTINSKCLNTLPAFYINSIGNILADIWLIIFVIPRIWRLKMAQKQKVALFAIITLSWLVVIAALVRVVRLSAIFSPNSNTGGDEMWDFYDLSIWTGLEVSMGIFCVSAPAMKPIFRRYAPGILSSYTNPGSKARSHTLEAYGSKPPFSNPASKHRWTLKQNGSIELVDEDSERSGEATKTIGPIWAIGESNLERGMGSVGKGGIMKSTNLS